ncbi:MAG: hypothetical protein H6810_05665 [Phycisphaeraceae bacterium]|nr:MAG: hypothetical protein H6810_05665 [Phycisphaeraceae bacterium]
MPSAMTLYNTLTNRAEPVIPGDPGLVTFYTCGPTVYDDAHIGNFRSFLAADLLRRFLESPLCTLTAADGSLRRGPRRVLQVMNITDVGHMTDDSNADGGGEDKMAVAGRRIAEAKKAGKIPDDADVDPGDPRAIARFFADRFLEDAKALGLKVAIEAEKDASLMPRASACIDGMRAVISRLLETGSAYTAGEPGSRAIYFDVRTFEPYGRLSGNTLDKLRGGAGGRVSEANQSQKRHPADFLLWKEDASHLMKWPAPASPHTEGWDEGYPGWHIECTAMSLGRLVPGGLKRILGTPGNYQIDLHSGGEDNIFPHHECELAQSCALTGAPAFARHWFHARYLMVEGAKMSKSKGTFFTARDLFVMGHEPAAVRLELIKTHYRANADFSMEGLKGSAKFVDRLRRFLDSCPQGAAAEQGRVSDHPVLRVVADALHDDLNIAGALGEISKWMNETTAPTAAAAAAVRTIDAILGLLDRPRAESRETEIGVYIGVEPDAEVEALLAERAAARKAKDYARSDAIRDELAARGYAIKDVAGGKVEVGRA